MRIIDIIQLVSAVLLIIAILMQSGGSGLGSAFGGGDSVSYRKRGAEKGLFILTVILSVIFLVTAFINAVL